MTRDTDDTTDERLEETTAGVLSPDELELPDDVAELDEGRYVVPTEEGDRPSVGEADAPAPTPTDGPDAESSAAEGRPTAALSGAYAAAVTMRTPEGTDATQVETDDVRELFEELLVWYAEQMAPGNDPEEALSVLLAESSLSVEPFDD